MPRLLTEHGDIHSDNANYEKAFLAYERAIRLDPRNDDAYFGLEKTLSKFDSYEKLRMISKVLANKAGNLHHEQALTILDRAIKFDPGNMDAYQQKRTVLRKLKRYGEADAVLRDHIQPKNPQAPSEQREPLTE